jgi:prephenate dehydratase
MGMPKLNQSIAYQGAPGAYSHLACAAAYPDRHALSCATFEDTFQAVRGGRAELAMVPIENSIAGRVADIHYMLPESGLFIVGEHFHPVNHQLLAPKGATLDGLKVVHSHLQALGQCRELIAELALTPQVEVDTAGAARDVANAGDITHCAIASRLAAEILDLQVMREDIEDAGHNTTRFVILSEEPKDPGPDNGSVLTTFVFTVRNVPAALYKALGGFATNGINMVKLESYMVGGSFNATQFYADIDGHPESRSAKLAMEELAFFTTEVTILGTYPADPFRLND